MKYTMMGLLLLLSGCATVSPPKHPGNVCAIFEQYPDWYEAAATSRQRWGTPIQVMMAIIRYESSYRADAKPARKWYLGFIPGFRPSSAYGYAQALDGIWDEYTQEAGSWWSDRDDFADSIDFVGWYTHKARRVNGVSLWAADKLYLNYYEGLGGYRRGTFRHKTWLKKRAQDVAHLASTYGAQLRRCEKRLKAQQHSWF